MSRYFGKAPCKFCGKKGVYWERRQLFNLDGSRHDCPEYRAHRALKDEHAAKQAQQVRA